MSVNEVRALLARMDRAELHSVFDVLRREHKLVIHPIEDAWSTTAEAVLEAIYAAPDLTQRGVRGVLAEAIFRTTVVPNIGGWKPIDFEGDLPYDLLMDPQDGREPLKVQVKNQRRERGIPKVIAKLAASDDFPVYVVETQRTRTGKRAGDDGQQKATRPYRFGEFDLLAVCLHPSSGSWEDFIYCPANLLLARPSEPDLLAVMQPIYTDGSHGWTRDFQQAAAATYSLAASRATP